MYQNSSLSAMDLVAHTALASSALRHHPGIQHTTTPVSDDLLTPPQTRNAGTLHLLISNCTHSSNLLLHPCSSTLCSPTPQPHAPSAPPPQLYPLQPPHTLSVTPYQSGAARNGTAHTTLCIECAHTNSTTITTAGVV